MVKRVGLFGGPLLGLLCYHLRPPIIRPRLASGSSSRQRGAPRWS
jgi:hypothetical protein